MILKPTSSPSLRRSGPRVAILAATATAAIALTSAPSIASGQQLGGQRFRPAGSEDGVLGIEGADQRRLHYPYVALWAHYMLDPVVAVDGDTDRPLVEHALSADLVASIAVWKGLELGAALPVVLFQSGDEAVANALFVSPAEGAGLGDMSLRVAYRFELGLRDSLAVHVPVLLPTAKDDDTLALGWGVRPTLAYTHGFERADLTFNASYLFRERKELGDYAGGQELGLGVGTRIGLDEHWNTALLASVGVDTSVHDFFGAAETPVEPRLGVEHWFGQHMRLTGFAGTGISRGVGAPDLRVGASVAFGNKPGRPRRDGDRDSDGVLDAEDKCPDEPEDVDGFEDRDGCPDHDNDQDGIDDEDDACPLEPETHDGIADDDGCPDQVRVEGSLITTFEPVRFKTNSAEIEPQSHGMLREIAGVMRANPGMEIHVAGHADAKGDEEHNLELSEARAQSVRTFVISQGVESSRIDAKGYGEDKPVADNESTSGRRKNRRVEFHIKGRQ